MTDSTMHALLARLRTAVPDCVAAMAIDLDGGALLACDGETDATASRIAADVLRDLLRRTREVAARVGGANEADDAPQEVLVVAADRAYVAHELPGEQIAVAAISENIANLGLVLAIVRGEVAAGARP